MGELAQSAQTQGSRAKSTIEWTLPGFGPMTRVSTSFGEVHAQAIRERDMIRTQDGSLKSVVWVDRMRLDSVFMKEVPDAHAVLVRAGALGNGLPKADITLSPEQMVGLGRHGQNAGFKKAKELVGRPGVVRKPEELMTYTLFHCGEPVIARVEGVWTKIDP